MADTPQKFAAFMLREADKGKPPQAALEQIGRDELPQESVLVRVAYSTLNYKDGLAITGSAPIVRRFPMVAGIDLAGEVVESASDRFAPGDEVVVNGYGLSERHWGGYA
ncbi:MAG: alcohol dehydrogenase catalytic domain-containing protein, partial [Hyphomicrobiales bacterium]|nr:alcohol dehydrogenase catalytic domain-containing protein [Hyphomicrobiales bacterium]